VGVATGFPPFAPGSAATAGQPPCGVTQIGVEESRSVCVRQMYWRLGFHLKSTSISEADRTR
jgi:hypothetical protein